MALDQAANFVREDVTSAISAGDTTINVADASPFPVPPEGYNIVVWDGAAYVRPDQDPDVEIMRVTDTDTTNDTLTVARGQEGTTDVSHPDTSVVVVAQTAKMIADIASEKISNPVTETVNVDGNDVTNVGALETDQATINNGDAIGIGSGTTEPSLSFDTWRTPNADRPTLLVWQIKAETDGSNPANIDFNVDESGGTNEDWFVKIFADSDLGAGAETRESLSVILPAGASYEFEQFSDPNNNNEIRSLVEKPL